MKVDMSKEAVTSRMRELNQLWELTLALQSSDLKNARRVEKFETPEESNRQNEKKDV